jgi:hypothetical protein
LSNIIYKPYTYYISWSRIDRHYYGSRYAKNCSTKDLWTTYFTSSYIVKEFRKQYGEPDIIQIRKIFDTQEMAKSWETKVLRRLKVLKSDRWLNANIGGEQYIIRKHRPETIEKMKRNNASKRPEIRKFISERQTGSTNSFYGKHHTEESKRIKSEQNKGYYWWTDGQIEIKSKICPSGFIRGRKPRF